MTALTVSSNPSSRCLCLIQLLVLLSFSSWLLVSSCYPSEPTIASTASSERALLEYVLSCHLSLVQQEALFSATSTMLRK